MIYKRWIYFPTHPLLTLFWSLLRQTCKTWCFHLFIWKRTWITWVSWAHFHQMRIYFTRTPLIMQGLNLSFFCFFLSVATWWSKHACCLFILLSPKKLHRVNWLWIMIHANEIFFSFILESEWDFDYNEDHGHAKTALGAVCFCHWYRPHQNLVILLKQE